MNVKNTIKKIMNHNTILRNNKTTRSFNYEKNGVKLAFSLTIDDNKQLDNFKDLLEVARDDVMSQIKKNEAITI